MRSLFLVILGVHGVIHFLGFAKAFGLADLPELALPISRPWGALWFAGGVLTLATAAMLPLSPRWWWTVGTVAVIVSQTVIVSRFSEAKFGTLPNVVIGLGLVFGFAHRGPWSLPAEFERYVSRNGPGQPTELLKEADLVSLPEPVRRYVRAAGVVGKPRAQTFRATWIGRIRAGPKEEWMAFTAEQLDTLDPPRRFFLMDAKMKGFPVDVLHALDERGATMRVRLLAVKTMVNASGTALTRSETVTWFNDLCVLAPGELVLPSVTWEPVDDVHAARASYTQGPNTIHATLQFNGANELVDFASADRNPSPDGSAAPPTRWSTPVRDYGEVGPARVARKAKTMWHPADGSWTYGEFELLSLEYNADP